MLNVSTLNFSNCFSNPFDRPIPVQEKMTLFGIYEGALNVLPSIDAKTVTGIFCGCSILFTALSLFDNGLADFLGLEVSYHGTAVPNYFKILYQGTKPNLGGSKHGFAAYSQSAVSMKASKGYFHMTKEDGCYGFRYLQILMTRDYLEASTETFIPQFLPYFLKAVIIKLFELFTPSLKFRFKPETISKVSNYKLIRVVTRLKNRIFSFFNPPKKSMNTACFEFEDAPLLPDLAYRTKQPIPFYHIGLLGTFSQGFDKNTWSRMKKKPLKSIQGIFQMTISILGLMSLSQKIAQNSANFDSYQHLFLASIALWINAHFF